MTLTELPAQATDEIRKLVDNACENLSDGLPCAGVVVVGDGCRHATEMLAYPTNEPNEDSDIYWLASCTKLVTVIACMQLVEQGKLDLDDSEQVQRFCPELGEVQVLLDDGSLVDKEAPITLRMLLTHTAGFGYSFLNPKLGRYDEFSGNFKDFCQPLVNQPGSQFEYGINHDWVGILIERVTGQKLDAYFRENIFKPLGINNMTLIPSEDMIRRCKGIWNRGSDGLLSPRQYPLSKPLQTTAEGDFFHSGGGGLFGSIKDFGKIICSLLNEGTYPVTGTTILSTASVQKMFKNQLPQWPDFARHSLPAVKPSLVYPADELYPLCPQNQPQGWGLGFMISPGVTGRSATTGHWSGLSNVFWWCDREKGIGGVVASQVLPFVDPKAALLWAKVEETVYKAVNSS